MESAFKYFFLGVSFVCGALTIFPDEVEDFVNEHLRGVPLTQVQMACLDRCAYEGADPMQREEARLCEEACRAESRDFCVPKCKDHRRKVGGKVEGTRDVSCDRCCERTYYTVCYGKAPQLKSVDPRRADPAAKAGAP